MKKLSLVIPAMLAAAMLASCGAAVDYTDNENTVNENEVLIHYENSVDATEEIESGETSGEETSGEESGETSEETPVEDEYVVSSYSIRYVSDYTAKVSIGETTLIDESDTTTYSLDYENDADNGVLFKASLSTTDNTVEEDEATSVEVAYQNETLYTVQNGWKIAYNIDSRSVRREFGDYFVNLAKYTMFDTSSREANKEFVEELKEEGKMTVISEEENALTFSFEYSQGTATFTVDTEHDLFTKISYEYSLTDLQIPMKHWGETLNIEEYTYNVTIDLSYNETDVTPLSEEETSEYHVVHSHSHKHGHDGDHRGW